ncbi:MAG: RDD family protein [Candidatus Hodarchaeota archaeon]
MAVKKEISSETEFISQVSKWLPYRTTGKSELLQELNQDLLAAYEDAPADLSTEDRWKKVFSEFGTPENVAQNLVSSQAELYTRGSYPRRAVAYFIDLFVSLIFGILFFIIAGFMTYFLINSEISEESALFIIMLILAIVIINSIIILGVVAMIAYFVFFEMRWSTTLGKHLFGMQVVSEVGLRLTWQQSLVRNLSKLSSQFLFFDWLIGILLKTDRQRGLDIAAKSQVVYYI